MIISFFPVFEILVLKTLLQFPSDLLFVNIWETDAKGTKPFRGGVIKFRIDSYVWYNNKNKKPVSQNALCTADGSNECKALTHAYKNSITPL